MKTLLSSMKMRGWLVIAAVSVFAVVSFWNLPMLTSGKNDEKAPKKQSNENYDIRNEESARQELLQKRGLSDAPRKEISAALGQKMKTAQERLAKQNPNLDVEWSKETGAPEIVGVLSSKTKLTGRSKADRAEIVRSFVANNSDLYGLSKAQIGELKTVANYTNPAGNMSFVEIEQRIDGIPVFQGNIRAGLTKNGELVRTTGMLVPGLDYKRLTQEKAAFLSNTERASSTTASSAAEAVAAGAASIGINVNPAELVVKEVSEDGTYVVFERGPFADDIKMHLVYFPLESGTATLSWSMTLWEDNPAYYTLVDAQSGDLLWRKNVTNDQTQSATYSFYNDDSPAPFSPFIGLPGSNIQAPPIPRTTLSTVSELPAFDNFGWITDGGTTTTGNNVDAGLDLAAPNGIDAGSRPVSATRNFVYDYNPAPEIVGATGSNDPTNANYRAGIVTNMFVWTNRYHDILYQYGFTEAARNFQQSNFGRNPGGANANAINGNDRVLSESQDYSGTNNANFSTPADGSSGRMQMFIWGNPTPKRDGDIDQNISIHEMTHGTSNRLHNNASGLGATISGGMGEGWSDFYARMILSTADEDVDGIFNTGGYATYLAATNYTDNYYYGIRRFPSVVKSNVGPNGKPHNPLTLADIDPNQIDLTDGAFARGPFGVGGRAGAIAVHNIGEVWSIALFEVRARIIKRMGYAAGNARMMQLTTDAMKLDGTNPSLLVGRNSLLAADVAFRSEDALDIWAGFATRGMGYGATITPQAQFTSGTRIQNVKESFDNPLPGMEAVTTTDNPCSSNGRPDAGENVTFSVPLTNPLSVEITGVSAQVTGGGSANYGTIAPGETITRDITYRVHSNIACGSKVTVSVVVNSSLGTETKTFDLQTGTPSAVFSENFDGVTAPALPAGWTTTNSGGGTAWTTSSIAADTPPNAASTVFGAITGRADLVTPVMAVPANGNTQLTFRHSYNSEFLWDGGALFINIEGVTPAGSFTEILGAGGTFETGGYNWVLNAASAGNTNVLQNFAAWTGNSNGFITTTVNLPAAAAGRNVQFIFIGGSDSEFAVPGSHWRIDSLALNEFVCPPLATTTTAAPASGQYSDGTTLSATVSADCDYPEGSLEFRVDGVLVGTVTVNGTGTYSTPYTITDAPGNHTITANFISSNPHFANSSGSNTLAVSQEDASVSFPNSNPFAVKVNSSGGTAGPITVCADITEVPDGSAGDISNATASFTFTPVAGSSAPVAGAVTYSGGGVGGTLRACTTINNVAVDVYDIIVTVNNYYTGSGTSYLAVFDPSLPKITGGGTVNNNGNSANFNISVQYDKNNVAKGSVQYTESRPSGAVKVEMNSIQSLSIVGNTAVFIGNGTINGAGNYTIRVTAVDNGEPGKNDKYGLRVSTQNNAIVPDLTFAPATITGGNIQLHKK